MFFYRKSPLETQTLSIDFSNFLLSSNIASYSATAMDSDGNNATSIIKQVTQSGTQVLVVTQAGTAGITYKISVIVKTDLNNVYEEDIVLIVSAYDILADAKNALRIIDMDYDAEIYDLINACESDLVQTGITVLETDPLIKRAIITYCKAYFGYDADNAEGFINAYEKIKIYLMSSSFYNGGAP